MKKHTCQICSKSFRSPKSLFGHMRCHPERPWRGMNPPANSSRPITTSLHQRVDLLRLLPSLCPSECKRPRTCRIDVGAAAAVAVKRSMKVDEDELVKGAVYGLMLLATGDDRYTVVPSKQGHDDVQMMSSKQDHDPSKGPAAATTTTTGKKRKLNLVKSYTCGICSKNFPTPQALGGHTSSAHGNKMLIKNMEDKKGECSSLRIVIRRGGGGGIHACKVCDKVFPSGQALGGHMGLHSQAAAAEGEARLPTVGGKQGIACLDLNEIPMDGVEEGVDAANDTRKE